MKLTYIDKIEAARYMGHRGSVSPQLYEILTQYEKLLIESIEPVYTFRIDSIIREGDNITAPHYLSGDSIAEHLKGCDRVITLAATLTAAADRLIRTAETCGMTEALALDALCGAAIEQVLDIAEEEIFSGFECSYRTTRYSPGYGDFPLENQKTLLRHLDAYRKIGLTVTDAHTMIPTKSVTAVIGFNHIA